MSFFTQRFLYILDVLAHGALCAIYCLITTIMPLLQNALEICQSLFLLDKEVDLQDILILLRLTFPLLIKKNWSFMTKLDIFLEKVICMFKVVLTDSFSFIFSYNPLTGLRSKNVFARLFPLFLVWYFNNKISPYSIWSFPDSNVWLAVI